MSVPVLDRSPILPFGGAARLQRLRQRADHEQEQRHAEQHEQAELTEV